MSEFDFDQPQSTQSSKPTSGDGGWHWPLTLMSILIVGGLSFLMAYLTRDVAERPLWMMGLIFAVPMAAMLFANLFVEFHTDAMTPRYVRGKQVLIAIAATLATFLVGCLCDAIYLSSYVKPVRTNTIFVLDKSTSMADHSQNGLTMDKHCNSAVLTSLEGMSPATNVGMVLFSHYVIDTEPMLPLSDAAHANRLQQMAVSPLTGATDFSLAMQAALDLVRTSGTTTPTQIIFVTDGEDSSFRAYSDEIADQCLDMNVRVDVIGISADAGTMQPVVKKTGGRFERVSNASNLTGVMSALAVKDMDMLRTNDAMANLMSGVMLILEGVVIGLGLWLMFSVRGQLRFQLILSPLMGVLALVLLKFAGHSADDPDWWMIEGAAFSLLGVVFMMRNRVNVGPLNKIDVIDHGMNDSFEASADDLGF